MAEPARPYTPETLAERWDCSAQHVRRPRNRLLRVPGCGSL